MHDKSIFEDLFVLEMTNNHRGDLGRGLEIVKSFSQAVHNNHMAKTAIKIQIRDLDNFVHKNYLSRPDIPYIGRITDTRLSKTEYALLINAIRENGCIPIATPFDEESVSWCVDFDLPIIKVASVDSDDWFLLEKIAETNKPVMVSVGGTSFKNIDKIVKYFESLQIPLAINHCVAAYPTEDNELELNQIDFLKERYPNNIIGFSSHEHVDWTSSILIAYAKGARLFERHIDIGDDASISPYSSLPTQIDVWFKAYNKAKEMCGSTGKMRKTFSEKEKQYLDTHLRGIYAKIDLAKGHILSKNDIYLAIPLLKGQHSTREIFIENQDLILLKPCKKDQPITFDMIETQFFLDDGLQIYIKNRGYE